MVMFERMGNLTYDLLFKIFSCAYIAANVKLFLTQLIIVVHKRHKQYTDTFGWTFQDVYLLKAGLLCLLLKTD